jgi:hypothetical protein
MLNSRFAYMMGIVLCFVTLQSNAQIQHKEEHLVEAIVVGTDTFAMLNLKEFVVYKELSPADRRRLNRQARRQQRRDERADAAYVKLRYNVYKVYPYALTAAYLLKDVHQKLAQLHNKSDQKKYLKAVEKELNKRFKGELEQFTIPQGIVLVKLINRQTGRSCFDIIQEVKGGFNAVVWQGVALVFSNNLRREYDPEDRDSDIEAIVREIENAARR